MVWVLMLSMMLETPEPISTWKVSFPVRLAVVLSEGESLLFNDTDGYTYDRQGNLLQSFSLPFRPMAAFTGPDDSVWVHDGDQLLGKLNENYNLHWQSTTEMASIPPFSFHDDLIYAVENVIRILDPQTGSVKYSLLHADRVVTLLTAGNAVLFFDEHGHLYRWSPLDGEKEEIYSKDDREPRFLAASHRGEYALAYEGGLLRVLRESRRGKWRRNYHIEISVPPLWMLAGDKQQLVGFHCISG